MDVGLCLGFQEWVRVQADETFIVLSLISPQVRGVPTCEYASRRINDLNPTCKAGTSPFEQVELHLSLLTVCTSTLMVEGFVG